MKKLMILGGSRYIVPVIEKAHELGIYVITCDYLPDNIAHKYSDEYINVSIVEKEEVLKVAQQLKIDGIISFACDPGVVTAAYIAEIMGLPFQCSYESTKILQDKGRFRQFLIDNGFNSPNAQKYRNIHDPLYDIAYFNWPVIVKPTDSAGSKGVTKVDSPTRIVEAAQVALDNSIDGSFIVEDFITFEGYHSSADPFTVDGKIKFITYSDQLFDNEANNPYTPAYIIWPSTMKIEHQKYLTSEIQRLFDLLKVKTGIYNIETCIGNSGTPYIMEVSPRGGGCKIAELQEFAYNQHFIENEIRKAVGMDLLDISQSECDGYWCETVIHSNNDEQGIFKELYISDSINDNVRVVDLSTKSGDLVHPFSGANMSLGDMFLRFDSREELDDFVKKSRELIKIQLK
ncbi:MAG: ATP-grasp domain-containing protein [Eubacterium sp.]|nr:ATP-grasp domain-containing protein [Eubacterium sp.]